MHPQSVFDVIITSPSDADLFNTAVWNGFFAQAGQLFVVVKGDKKLADMVAAALGLQYFTPGVAKWYGDPVTGRVIALRSGIELDGYKKVDISWV